uniref:(California timema) hypothetical protein n=1 Tax=Timema californicum TaxID=61474 RepID=A0A7R9J6X8_TIMCA|nr:unnamed protein product [Timema californicum]
MEAENNYSTSCECAFDEELSRKQADTITAAYFKNHVLGALRTLFGGIGSSVDIDVLKYDEDSCRAILRCPATSYVKLRSSLTLCGDYSGIPCAYRVRNASPCLLSLLGDSRTYQHN